MTATDLLIAFANARPDCLYIMPGISDRVAGFLTPRGEVIQFANEESHTQHPTNAGTSLEDLMREGMARLHVSAPFFTVEIHQPPTREQESILIRYPRIASYRWFAIDVGNNKATCWPKTVGDELVTPRIVREQIKIAFT